MGRCPCSRPRKRKVDGRRGSPSPLCIKHVPPVRTREERETGMVCRSGVQRGKTEAKLAETVERRGRENEIKVEG